MRNILPKSDEMQQIGIKNTFRDYEITHRLNTDEESSSNEENRFKTDKKNKLIQISKPISFQMNNFSKIRLNQWHTNEEIYNILQSCCLLMSEQVEFGRETLKERLSNEVKLLSKNGSVILFDKRRVKNFKKDSFTWKRRKTGGANSVREDRMLLKVNGVDTIYGCYSHSSIMSTFHRRCYWLRDKTDIVLVHYLQTPNADTGECLISLSNSYINFNNSNNNGSSTDLQLTKEDLIAELKAMLWPYYLGNFLIIIKFEGRIQYSYLIFYSNAKDYLSSQFESNFVPYPTW